MVNVRIVRVSVHQPCMEVLVCVGLVRRIIGAVRMLMMFIVRMAVGVAHGLVNVVVVVALGEMEP